MKMVVTRSLNTQMVTRSTPVTNHYFIQYAKPSKKKTKTQNVSKLPHPTTAIYDYIPRYWDEEDTSNSKADLKQDIQDNCNDIDNDSVITEIDDILRHEKQIDFDEAHEAWMANKKKTSNGCYVYLCGKSLKNGKSCRRQRHDTSGLYSGCQIHYAWEEAENKYL